jgi:prepilin-type N-terminal cleavage/methylation domain-containing protein
MCLLLRRPPPRSRRGFTLLELLVVLVLLGLAAAFVVPMLRLPAASSAAGRAIERARATAVRRGESVRLAIAVNGDWTVRATADTTGTILLSGTGAEATGAGVAHALVISALGSCLPEGRTAVGTPAWDPTRCVEARR